jgi:hypothetical protein
VSKRLGKSRDVLQLFTKLSKSLTRWHVSMNRHLQLSPPLGVFIVIEGLLKLLILRYILVDLNWEVALHMLRLNAKVHYLKFKI